MVSKVVSIAASTLENQPHLDSAAAAAAVAEAEADAQQGAGAQQAQQQQAQRRPRLASLPSAATLTKTYNSVGPLLESKPGERTALPPNLDGSVWEVRWAVRRQASRLAGRPGSPPIHCDAPQAPAGTSPPRWLPPWPSRPAS